MAASLLTSSPSHPDLVALSELINTWGGPQRILVQAYGNFQVQKAKISEMLQKLWEFSRAIQGIEKTPTFSRVYDLLVAQTISSLPQGGIVVWLICCDFAEYALCDHPKATELAKHILGKKSKPSGPTKGLEVAGRMFGMEGPLDSVESLAVVLEEVMAVLSEPDRYGKLNDLLALVDDCQRLQGRKFTVVDLEHGLCKMAREDSLR